MIRSSNHTPKKIIIDQHTKWAEQQFAKSELGDLRRTARLVKLASTLANEPGKPLVNIIQPAADMEIPSIQAT
ncbi:transposase DNA-binding-containing protein [Pseudoalteromonas luteoviolacea]|uniref:Transposase Tn5-like N-terminal domain-containing protein n=1 Tax=Pseudoalteromonas luteoviolacea NCIMB 1942 TaxID=1365253 RepID=A0A166ZC95_9GAMM|nr:hypothetical protein N482_17330 [Pseudoalteromonas luteoviolacea NCIMB 1942]KZW98740.1 hypothetical protein JL49_21195 [Pseudoalteromonas luteoviolacea]